MAIYTVRSRTSGIQRVQTNLTGQQALQVLRDLCGDSDFAQSLLRQYNRSRRLSTTQWNWVFVLAVQAQRRQVSQVQRRPEPIVAAFSNQDDDQGSFNEFNDGEYPTQEPQEHTQQDEDEQIPPLPAGDPSAFSSDLFAWSKDSKTFTAQLTDLGMAQHPSSIRIQSARTGSVLEFFRTDREGTMTIYANDETGIQVRLFGTPPQVSEEDPPF